MSETAKIEVLLASGDQVRLGRRDAHEVLQKLRARGAGSESADRIESELAKAEEVVLEPDEARAVLEELRASGRRWISGSEAPRERPQRAREPERKPDPQPERPGKFRRLWHR
jgi:hypothetical protein